MKKKQTPVNKPVPVFMTIGHSTRPIQELVELLHSNGVTMLIDVRTIPKSRTNPQFNSDTLAEVLLNEDIQYRHMAGLGGLRHAKKSSQNTVWKNASFRGYADYMETDAFQAALIELLQLASKNKIAIMCAEMVWWRCHRSMLADELVAEGYAVEHIMSDDRRHPHTLRSFAHVENGHVSYK